ncbi:hypothetical protein [Methylobacterium sp. WL7]|uniref:hypothetical protein n=1 Tax=Methylobacterium sp. WL7 TaxID=2603900 RepID=UPI0011C76962|nr:hypothetical protein [Methylobacterium sp. WL7]TXN43404.1 hypothetical protein FV233_18560 [Methylobacterium sp. WL7]
MHHFLVAAAALFTTVLPARADQILGFGRIDNGGRVMFGGPKLDGYQNDKFTSQPNAIQIRGSTSTGEMPGASAKASGGTYGRPLGDWLATTQFNVATISALRAWPAAALVGGAEVRTSGYYAAADRGGAEYLWSATSAAADDGCLVIAPTGLTDPGRWLRQLPNGSDISLLTCGVVADYDFGSGTGTDNTAALQAAVFAAQSPASQGEGYRLTVPSGAILSGGITVAGQVEVVGAGSASSVFVLKSASKSAMFIIKTSAKYNYTNDGHPAAAMHFSKFRIAGQAGVGGNTGAHGFDFVSGGAIPAWVRLDDITAYNLSGSGVHANGFSGFAEFTRSSFIGNAKYGTDTGSTADWRYIDCDWGGNTSGNFRSQHDVQMTLYNPNISGAGGYGAEIFQSDLKVSGGSIDLNNKSGIRYVSDPKGVYRLVLTGGFSFGGNGRSATNRYHDLEIHGSGTGVLLSGARFSHKPHTQDVSSEITNNIYIDPDSTASILENSNQFAGGSIASQGVTNAPNRFGAAFTPYTPSMLASGASTFVAGNTSGRYQLVGKRLDFSLNCTITKSGDGSTWVAIALPGTLMPSANGAIAGFGSNAKILSGQIIAGKGYVFFRNADGTYPGADGLTITASGSVEIQ